MTEPMNPVPLRRAALAVHALSHRDRTWLLDALSTQERESLRPLLAELHGLGLPGDPSCLAGFTTAAPSPGRDEPELAWSGPLEPAAVAALGRVLEREPVALTNVLLSMRAWSWAPELLAAMGEGRRAQVQSSRFSRALSPRLHEAILKALDAEIAREPSVATRRPNRWRALLDRFGRSE